MVKEFKEFLLRGNLLDLAVAVVIGAAFTGVVTALTVDVITPLIKAIFGGSTQFNSLEFTINGSQIFYGKVLTALLNFVIVAAVIFFLVIKPVNSLMKRLGRVPSEEPVRECPECLSKVPDKATKCAYCASVLTPTAA
jgi:large conductance mechanosensitive channel